MNPEKSELSSSMAWSDTASTADEIEQNSEEYPKSNKRVSRRFRPGYEAIRARKIRRVFDNRAKSRKKAADVSISIESRSR